MLATQYQLPASEFKAKCLQLMEEVYRKHIDITITKRGKPIAMLVPLPEKRTTDIFGSMAGSVTIHGDIIAPIDESWEASE